MYMNKYTYICKYKLMIDKEEIQGNMSMLYNTANNRIKYNIQSGLKSFTSLRFTE